MLVEEFRAKYQEPEAMEFQPLASPLRATPPAASGCAAVRARRGDRGAAAVALLAFLLIPGPTAEEDEPERRVDRGPAKQKPKAESSRRARPPPQRVEMRVIPAVPTYVCVDRGPEQVVFEGTLDAPQTFRARGPCASTWASAPRSCG